MTDQETISPAAFCARLGAGDNPQILDVRTALEHRSAHLTCPHEHVPLHQFEIDAWLKGHPVEPGRPVYVVCASGRRASAAAGMLATRGINSVVVEGGINACMAQGLPTQGQKIMSLERQVRIAAGSLVMTAVLLGAFVSPAFYLLAGAVGAGLVFAGVTDRCGMALLLAHAPWNADRTSTAAKKSLASFERQQHGA